VYLTCALGSSLAGGVECVDRGATADESHATSDVYVDVAPASLAFAGFPITLGVETATHATMKFVCRSRRAGALARAPPPCDQQESTSGRAPS
jgi:hypothetical protein